MIIIIYIMWYYSESMERDHWPSDRCKDVNYAVSDVFGVEVCVVASKNFGISFDLNCQLHVGE